MAFNFISGNIMKGRSISSALLNNQFFKIKGPLRSALMKLQLSQVQRFTVAKVTISNLENDQSITLALTPDKVSVKKDGRFQTYNIIEKGEVQIPRGQNLAGVSWSSVLPSEAMSNYGFVFAEYWKKPDEVASILDEWRKAGNKLKLLITQTGINMDVYIKSFDYSYEGTGGSINYSIEFIAAEPMLVKTVSEKDENKQTEGNQLKSRPEKPVEATATVSSGDSLWSIAQDKLGDGSRWQEIYDLNKDKISDPDMIYAGQELNMPSK
ncbi:LysM peptidoglycan-binding domain-containing protein [Anaerovibrio sp. RM50]|uniref:LysM peptidoglycan-binding domain-containing protein n=1 Tax=Anaerovibrio sp. RM50 TaxID=1200557 RepID=UPI00048091BB|nr:LysM peptidoglycan-binding domain-containing protein [Anaerovibrio sp. RM50]